MDCVNNNESSYMMCGNNSYNVLPSERGIEQRPVLCPKPHVVCTTSDNAYNVLPTNEPFECNPIKRPCKPCIIYSDKVFDKELGQYLSEINKNIGEGGGSGANGENALLIQLYTDVGNILDNTNTTCTIFAEVWNGREDITDTISNYDLSWTRVSNDPISDAEWNSKHSHIGPKIIVSKLDILKHALFQCFFDFNEHFKEN